MTIADTAATYIGIHNDNEFYSHHYLSEVFRGDIKALLDDWQRRDGEDESTTAPPTRLRALHREYFAMRQRLQRERSERARIGLQRDFFAHLLPALDYDYQPANLTLEDHSEIPVLGLIEQSGQPQVLLLGALDGDGEGIDPLALTPHRDQWHGETPPDEALLQETWNDIISRRVYGQTRPPRWVLLLSDRHLLLIDRAKWHQNRLLRFDWEEILGRRDDATLKATAALLHRDSLIPADGISLLDNLDENAHRHAFAVSEDLKYALREAIELIGNEAARYLINEAREQKKGIYSGEHKLDAEQLTRECLRTMYRLLFLFYIEARPDLGYVPLQSDAYRKGYSLESLRDLELVRLTSEESRNGYFLHESIQRLFDLIHRGYSGVRDGSLDLDLGEAVHNSFQIAALDSHLFDPRFTPLLNRVRFRNETWQTVIRLLSLTRPNGRKRRGRVSYAQLGINQLGAVYEALLSYRGFFADQDLYEVKKAGEAADELKTGYFVPAEALEPYREDERVYDRDEHGHKTLRVFPKGTFIYRLAGRDRQKSASYYTPEALTRTLVKYALKELLQDKTADEILQLTVCEPAMGSAAFLNEAVNQLAEAYLARKQAERDERILHEDYAQILQQVKMYIADRNVFGVDLNPVAVELAEVSLWLNAIHGSNQVPWFGYQLFNGNSLIGARRQVYGAHLLGKRGKGEAWYEQAPLRLDPLNPERQPDQVYHFLLPDPGMANYTDKVAKARRGEALKKISHWRKAFCRPFAADDVETLQFYSQKIDELWAAHTRELTRDRYRTEDPLPVWGQLDDPQHQPTATAEKDRIRVQGIFNLNAKTASHYRRLKMVMDYWCALWFWPIEQAELLPDRDTFLMEIGLLLTGNVLDVQPAQAELSFDAPREEMIEGGLGLTVAEGPAPQYIDRQGQLHIEKLFEHFPRLKLVHELAERHKFFHWELSFADVFADRGGFDLVLGNPPWIKVEWQEGGVLGDVNPLFVLRNFSATKLTQEREQTFEQYPELERAYFVELEQAGATQNFLNGTQNYPLLKGVQSNLYKCFLPQAWMIGNERGIAGFLHPEGIYDDPKGGALRAEVYPRLRGHYLFQNQFKLFPEIDNQNYYGINIYCTQIDNVEFDSIANLFTPQTIDFCYQHDGNGAVSGIKTDEAAWNITGHSHRIIHVNLPALTTFAELYDETGTSPLQARLPALHTQELMTVLEKFVAQPRRLGDFQGEYFSTVMFDETYAQRDGTIRRDTRFPESTGEWVLSGPHFFVGTPLFKTPRAVCNTNKAYDVLDLTDLPDDYLPRTNYVPACDEVEYRQRTPRVPWIEEGEIEPNRVTEYYRLIFRGMLPPGNERTLFGCIVAKHAAHINGCRSYAFADSRLPELAVFGAMTFSVPFDFRIKSTGRNNLHQMLDEFPLVDNEKLRLLLSLRALSLCCVTNHYNDLWQRCWHDDYQLETWAKADERLPNTLFSKLTPHWTRHCAFRTDYARRQALVEIDVLAAMALGLTLDELITIYHVQFPVMRQYEQDTWYDANGRIVFTASKGLPGVGLPRKANKNDTPCVINHPDGQREEKAVGWEDIRDLPVGATVARTVIDDTLPGGPREKTITYAAPFNRCDREADYRLAWTVFSERFDNP